MARRKKEVATDGAAIPSRRFEVVACSRCIRNRLTAQGLAINRTTRRFSDYEGVLMVGDYRMIRSSSGDPHFKLHPNLSSSIVRWSVALATPNSFTVKSFICSTIAWSERRLLQSGTRVLQRVLAMDTQAHRPLDRCIHRDGCRAEWTTCLCLGQRTRNYNPPGKCLQSGCQCDRYRGV